MSRTLSRTPFLRRSECFPDQTRPDQKVVKTAGGSSLAEEIIHRFSGRGAAALRVATSWMGRSAAIGGVR